MALLYDKVVTTVNREPEDRTDGMIEQIVPWFRKKSELFKSQKTEIVKAILKNCQFTKCKKDFVIIKQGDMGDCFFIILSGSVAVHILTNLGEEGIPYDPETYYSDPFGLKKKKELDRALFGNCIGKIPAGRSFGELALINTDCVRNASIIADEPTDLIVINRNLYNSTLKSFQEKEYNEKKTFVEEYPLFSFWTSKYKKQLAMSLRKDKITFDGIVAKQGTPVDGVYFLLSGQAKMLVDPQQHEIQYPDKFPIPDVDQLEKVEARETIRRELNMSATRSDEKKYAQAKSPNLTERKKNHKSIEVCVMGAIEIIGDVEMAFGLSTHAGTCQCTQEAEVFVLDLQNFERLVEKRHPQSLDIMRKNLHQKLKLRLTWIHKELPLFRYFLYKLDERQRIEFNRMRMAYRRRDFRETIDYWKSGKLQNGPLIDMFGPGSVFYTIRMRSRNKGLLKDRNGMSRNQFGAYLSRTGGQRSNVASIREMVRQEFSNDKNSSNNHSNNVTNVFENEENELEKDEHSDEYVSDSDSDDDIDAIDGVLRENDTSKTHKTSKKGKGTLPVGCSVDEFMNQELNNLTLSKLETRIEQWHTKVDEIETERRPKSAKSHLVKLHRYHAENHTKPLPGTKVIVKPKARPKPTALTLHLEAVTGDSPPQTAPNTATENSTGKSRDIGSRDFGSRDGDQVTCVVPDKPLEDTVPSARRWSTKRPLSSKSDFTRSPNVQTRRRPKSARNYTAQDYNHLKEELRRKQIAYKSMLNSNNTCF